MKNHTRTRRQQRWHRACIALLALHFSLSSTALAAIDIPPIPLQSGTIVPPNVLFILDDSGSMAFNYMPDGLTNNEWSRNRYTSNSIYYNPHITYQPWRKADGTYMTGGTDYTAVYGSFNAASGDTINLSDPNSCRNYDYNGSQTAVCGGVQTFYVPKQPDNTDPTYLSNQDNYYRYQILTDGRVIRSERLARSGRAPNYNNGLADSGCTNTQNTTTWRNCTRVTPTGRSEADERKNFATWFSYHRTRIKVAKAAAGSAFADLGENYRVGYMTIWNRNTFRIPVQTDGGLFRGTNKQTWYDRLYAASGSSGTPLLPALQRAGQYFSERGGDGPWGPEPAANQVACRQNFAILTTDGYWNDKTNYTPVGNSDGTAGGVNYTPSKPYSDTYSDTLADVAMQYWKTDLRSDLPNIVPTTSGNPAYWQHMVTFGISIGLRGTLDPATDLPALTAGSKSWPDPTDREDAERIDDLWHATVNGRGRFVAAGDPQQLNDGIRQALGTISEQVSSASNVSANSTQLDTGTTVYQASYIAGTWTGELKAYAISGQGISTNAKWLASEKIPAHADRRIYTRSDDQNGKGIEFKWSALTSTQKTALDNSEDLVNYLRGDRSKERSQPGGVYRTRAGVLGDIVNSSPAYSADSNTIFIGANDGMLHAFNASTGAERFAYVPGSLIGGLKALADPHYNHRYFVDGEIAVSAKTQTKDKNYLVAALGRGGKGVIGLDVTNPGNFSGTDVLWEIGANDNDMGLVVGKILIAKANNGKWVAIFGNGYNSTNERAVLYIVDLSTGSTTKIDTKAGSAANSNGLGSPALLDVDRDGTVDYVYAGDLLGNLWKFDLTDKSANSWKVAFGSQAAPAPLFVAKDASGATQPITGQPAAVINDVEGDPNRGKRFVLFGTGRYLAAGDPTNLQVQTWYGIIDNDAQIDSRSQLKERYIVEQNTVSGLKVRAFSAASGNDMTGMQGWFVDLKVGATVEGERIVSASRVLNLGRPVLIASSIIPESTHCSASGRGYVNAINPFTGTALDDIFFDLNGDGTFNNADTLGGKIVGSVDLGVGMPTEAIVVGNRLAVGGSKGQLNSVGINISAAGRISWREIVKR